MYVYLAFLRRVAGQVRVVGAELGRQRVTPNRSIQYRDVV